MYFFFFGDNLKRLTLLLITIFFIYLIYSLFNISKFNYVFISDSSFNYNTYIKEYLHNKNKLSNFNDYFQSNSISKLYQDIRNNRTIRVNNEDYYIKKVLRESDVLVISVGMEELSNNYSKFDMDKNYRYFNDLYSDIQRLIKEIKKYVFGKIIFIGYYNPTNYYDSNVDRFFYDMNSKLNNLMVNNNNIYLDLYEIVKSNNHKSTNTIINIILKKIIT